MIRIFIIGVLIAIFCVIFSFAQTQKSDASVHTRAYASNGERIYFTGVSEHSGKISVNGGPGWIKKSGGGCVVCHRTSGQGGIPVKTKKTGKSISADIRYSALTMNEHKHKGKAEIHPSYTDDLIKRAVTKGLNSAGKSLNIAMPRFMMSEKDLNDLIGYLKTLE